MTGQHPDKKSEKTRILPDGWRWVRLGEVINQSQTGFACGERDSNGIVQLRMNNVDTRGNFVWNEFLRVPADQDKISKYRLSKGDILFNNTNSTELVGKSALFQGHTETVVYSNHFTRLRVNQDQLEPSYLASWLVLQWTDKVFENLCNRWIGQSAVKNGKLLSLQIPLPPLPEQKRIAEILNEQTEAIEKARKATEAQLEAAKSLPAVYLGAVFNSPEVRQWPKKKFEEVAILQRGYDLPSQNQILGKFPIMTSSGISGYHNECKGTPPGVITGRSGSIGKVYFVEEDYWPHNTALYVKDFKDNEPKYIFYLLQWLDLKTICSGSGVPTLDRKEVHKVIVHHPEKAIQQRIAIELSEQMASTEKLRQSLESQLAAINALPAVLLRRAFSGEL